MRRLVVLALSAISGACPAPPPSSASPSTSAPVPSSGPTSEVPGDHACVHRGSGVDYPVGPGQRFTSLRDVPFEDLQAGDTVRIHHRPEPYREKLMITGVGTAAQPIRVCGVPSASGARPVIEGADATTRPSLRFPFDGHQVRGLVVIGWRGDTPFSNHPQHIVVEGLELRGARKGNGFTDRSGARKEYAPNAAGVFVQRGSFITLRNNRVEGNGNGLFIGSAGGEELTRHVVVEDSHIVGNGYPTSEKEHNVYTEAFDVLYQRNVFGPPARGSLSGSNIKDRSAGVVIRHNWIEDGAYLVDLCDVQETISGDRARPIADPAVLARYRESHVYGNVFVRGPKPGAALVRYGGDSDLPERYRKGTLHFYSNTVVVENAAHPEWEGTNVFVLLTDDESLQSRNNLYFAEVGATPSRPIGLVGSRDGAVRGRASFAGDWVREGVAAIDPGKGALLDVRATVSGFDAATRGVEPGFVDVRARDVGLSPSSPLRGKGVALPYPAELLPAAQIDAAGRVRPRGADTLTTPGARAAE